tara:strand:+ start:8263 stop:9264 length:1002 start_codon:yes stop_codon:yes gene_type:complete
MKITMSGIIKYSSLALASSFLVASSAYAATKWSAYTYAPSVKLPSGAHLEDMASKMSDATGGELELQANLGGSLPIKVPDIGQAVADGIIQLGFDAYFQGFIPTGAAQRMPMLIVNDTEYDLAMLKVMMPHMKKKYAEAGVTLLGSYTYPLTVTYSRTPVTRLSDLAGRKIRVLSQAGGEFVKAFDGVPVNMSTPEVSTSLQQGVVDAIHAATAGGGQLWGPLVDHKYELGPNYVNVYLIANTEAYEALSEGTRAVVASMVEMLGDEVNLKMRASVDAINKQHMEAGMTITVAHPEDVAAMQKAMIPVWDKWAKDNGEEAAAVLNDLKVLLGR